MPDKDPTTAADAGKQVQPRPHDTGSQANETIDGLDFDRRSSAARGGRYSLGCLAR